MAHTMVGRVFWVKTLIRVAFTALSIGSIGAAHSEQPKYHAPAHNFYQNNWLAGEG